MDELTSKNAVINEIELAKTRVSHSVERAIGRGIIEILDDVEKDVRGLPPAEPKRGKWIYHIDDLFPAESTMECNQCHAEQPLICDDEFCPKCGAKMEGTE